MDLGAKQPMETFDYPDRITRCWSAALLCVDWPYVFGAWGEECSPANRNCGG